MGLQSKLLDQPQILNPKSATDCCQGVVGCLQTGYCDIVLDSLSEPADRPDGFSDHLRNSGEVLYAAEL